MGDTYPYSMSYKRKPLDAFLQGLGASMEKMLMYKWQQDMQDDSTAKRLEMERLYEAERQRETERIAQSSPEWMLKKKRLDVFSSLPPQEQEKAARIEFGLEPRTEALRGDEKYLTPEELRLKATNPGLFEISQLLKYQQGGGAIPSGSTPQQGGRQLDSWAQMLQPKSENAQVSVDSTLSGMAAQPSAQVNPFAELVTGTLRNKTKTLTGSDAVADIVAPQSAPLRSAEERLAMEKAQRETAAEDVKFQGTQQRKRQWDIDSLVRAGHDPEEAALMIDDPTQAELVKQTAVADMKASLDKKAIIDVLKGSGMSDAAAEKKYYEFETAKINEKTGEAMLSDNQKKFWAEVVLAKGGDLSQLGMGPQLRGPIMAEVAKLSDERGITPPEMVAQNAEYLANKGARTTLKRNASMIKTFARTTDANLAIVEKFSEKTDRSGSPAINRWYMAGMKKVAGDEDVAVLDAAMYTAATEYAKVVSTVTGGGVSTDTARKEAYDILNSALSKGQVKEVTKLLRAEMKNRILSYNEEYNNISRDMAEPYWWKDEKNFTGDRALPEQEGVEPVGAAPPKAATPKTKSSPIFAVPDAKELPKNPKEADRYDGVDKYGNAFHGVFTGGRWRWSAGPDPEGPSTGTADPYVDLINQWKAKNPGVR